MLKYTIEKDVPFPAGCGSRPTFRGDVISFLDRLKVGDSALVQLEKDRAYIFDTWVRELLKVYSIIKGWEFTRKLDMEASTVRIWRTR